MAGSISRRSSTKARHIEVQILGDGENFVHCFERECSLQRRRQKVWEEAPAFLLPQTCASGSAPAPSHSRARSAIAAPARSSISTTRRAQEFYFIEVNTRIQVEHPVTEMITGIDLVQEMIRVAGGEPALQCARTISRPSGHAIECRINAEDPASQFHAGAGHSSVGLVVPQGEGVRFDTMLYEGYTVPPFYDSLLGKLIVWAETRDACLERLREALQRPDRSRASRRPIPLHLALAADASVAPARFHTRFLEGWLETEFAAPQDARGGWPDGAFDIHSAATSISLSNAARRCRSRPSSRAFR